MDHPTAVVTPHASTRTQSSKVSSLERYIGLQVAGAAAAVALALGEFEDGGLTSETKMAGADLIAELFRVRQFSLGYWDFDKIAREQGVTALREANEMTLATAEKLVDATLNVLAKVTRAQAM